MWLFESEVQDLKSSPDLQAGIVKVLSNRDFQSLIFLLVKQYTAVCSHLWLSEGTLSPLFTLNDDI